ncbi:MAG TPA: aminotransferase class I/II-fold pyridoxal phosphate-dependent enzyme, partial [Verrucomicrobia bacterium]|nr:aminotransferase class I/II-fold pyridoxal phosphate-dependent enzyme [Verrucomicrobiota bacterium]
IELHSCSKSYNMTGWRIGFVAGNPLLVSAYANVKDNTDSGQFLAIQHSAAYSLKHPEITEKICAKYSRRMELLVEALNENGLKATKPGGSFFLYIPCPKAAEITDGERIEFDNAEAASQWLIREKQISTVPWDDAGAFLRFSVTFAAKGIDEEKRVIDEISRRLSDVSFVF